MGETINLIAVLENVNPNKLWRNLSRLKYIEETEEGLSIVPVKKLGDKDLSEKIYELTLKGIRLRGLLTKVSKKKIDSILSFDLVEIRRPLFGLMPDQNLLTFTFETEDGFGVEYVEIMLAMIEKDLKIEFEPAEEFDLDDFADEDNEHNIELLKQIAENEGEFDTWSENEDEDEDYPRRILKNEDEDEDSDTGIKKNPENPFW